MKRVLIAGASLITVVLIGAFVFLTLQPDRLQVERQIVVDAEPTTLKPLVRNFRGFNRWSPWADLDPNNRMTYSGATEGVGAEYHWHGNAEVGKGQMTLLEDEGDHVAYRVDFLEPFEGTSMSTVRWASTQSGTVVTWRFEQEADLMLRAINVVSGIETMIAADYEKGLANLKREVESDQQKHRAKHEAEAANAVQEAMKAILPVP